MKKTLLIVMIAILAVGAVFAVDGKYTVKASVEAPMYFYSDVSDVSGNIFIIYQAGVDYNFDNGVSVGVGAAAFPGIGTVLTAITADAQYKFNFDKFSLAANVEFISLPSDVLENVGVDSPFGLLVASEAGFMAYSLNPSYKVNDKLEVWGKLTYVPIFNIQGDTYSAKNPLECCSFGLGVAYNL